jgi:hypothetical protein
VAPAPTLDQLKAYVANGALRFVLAGGSDLGGFATTLGYGRDSGIAGWVRQSCTPVTISGIRVNGLYDCAGAT